MQKQYKEAIHLLINNNCRLEAIEKITEYRLHGIDLDTIPSASQIAEQSAEYFVDDIPKLKKILEHITSKAKRIVYYKKYQCYQEACELLLQQGNTNLAFRLLKAQKMYVYGIKKASELKLWRESKLFIIEKAIFNECSNIEEVQDLLHDQDCNIQGKACYLLGLKCKDAQLSRNAFKCYLMLGNLCGMVECFNLYASLCHDYDDEFFQMLVQACNSVQTAHSCIVSKNKTSYKGHIVTVIEHFYQLESSSDFYYFPRGQDVFQVHFEDLSDNCDSDGMLELQKDAALSKIDEHLASLWSSWICTFKELVLSKLSEYDFHNDLVGCGYLSHTYNLTAPQLKRYSELCCLALEMDPTLKNVLINVYSPNVSIYLPFSKEHIKAIRQSHYAVDVLCAEAHSILTKPDLTADDWLLGTRVLCIVGKGADCLKNRQCVSIEDQQYFDLWIDHLNMMGQECRVTNAISLVLQCFFTEKFVKDDRLLVGNTLSVAIVHSTALMAMWNSISSNKKAMLVPSIFEQHVHIFDALRPYHDSKCLFKACEVEVHSQYRCIQTLKAKIMELLRQYLDMMVGFHLYKQFHILNRTVQTKECIIKGDTKMCLILTLTLAANLSLIETNTINMMEYWKAIHCQIQPLLNCDSELLSDAVCRFASVTTTAQVYNVLATLIDSFNIQPSGFLKLKLTTQTLLQHSEFPERPLIIVSDQPLQSQIPMFPADKPETISKVSHSQMPDEVQFLFNGQKSNTMQHAKPANQKIDTKSIPNPPFINTPHLLDSAVSNSDFLTQLQSATEATRNKDILSEPKISSPLLLDNLQSYQLNSIQFSEPDDNIEITSLIPSRSSDPNKLLDRSLFHDPTPSSQQFMPGVTPEDDPFVGEAFCGVCGVFITPVEASMDASMTDSKYRERHIQSSQHSERQNQHQLFLQKKDDQCFIELKEKVKLQINLKGTNAYNPAILEAESVIKEYEQVLVRAQQTYNWRDGENEMRKVTQMMRDMNSKLDGKLQEVQQETIFQIDESNHKIDEDVDGEERIEIPGSVPMKQHKKTSKRKRKWS